MSDLSAQLASLIERPEFQQAMAQWPGNPQAALAQLRPIADAGDDAASVLIAALYPQTGQWNEGLPYARRAAELGIPQVLNNYVGNLVGDPANETDFINFLRVQLDAGWPVDPLPWVPQLLQQGRNNTARQIIEMGLQAPPAGARQRWEELLAETTKASDTIRATAATVEQDRDQVLAAIESDRSRVAEERQRAESLVVEVADLANEGASQHLAKEYAAQAAKEEDSADRYTKWALWVGIFTVLATCGIAYLAFTHEHGAGAVLTKASLALPIVAFAAYIARLAAIHRKQAWRWRHIELQIRTANSFVSPLEDDQRKLLIAALALRFFPGQRHDVEGAAGGETVDPVALLAELLPNTPVGGRATSQAAAMPGQVQPEA